MAELCVCVPARISFHACDFLQNQLLTGLNAMLSIQYITHLLSFSSTYWCGMVS